MPDLRMLTRACGLAALAAGILFPRAVAAQDEAQIVQDHVAAWYESASRKAPGTWGIAIADQQGRLIWGMRPDEPLIPASAVKLFTTGFARSVLGGQARRPTRVVGNGRVDAAGTFIGQWALELNGDVTLERSVGAGPSLSELAQQLSAAGIRRLTGPLAVQSADGPANAVWPAAWSPRHRGRLFAPLVGPLTLNENVIWVTVRPGKVGQRAQIVDASPRGIGSLVQVTARTRSGRRTRLTFRPRAGGGWVVGGTIGVRSGPRRFTATASDPKVVLAAAWRDALRRAGIEWTEKAFPAPAAPVPPKVLAEVQSPVLDSVASEVNRRSLNIGAELLLQWAGGRGEAGPAAMVQHIKDVTGDQSGVHLVDGSGLSNLDRVTPSTFVSYLSRFPMTPAGRNFEQLLPANGSGTLRRLNSGLPGAGVVRAKTGTLNDVSTIVGYLGRPEGVLVVSLMYNGPRSWAARQEQWQLFRVLGANGVVIPADTVGALQLGGDSADADSTAAQSATDSTAGGPAQ